MTPLQFKGCIVRREAGVSLVELMVAMVLGLFLMFGAVTVYNQSRATYRTNEAVSRLQEVGRLALNVIETDVRMANYWGLSNRADYIINAAGPDDPPASGFTGEQLDRIDVCGGDDSNWAVNLRSYIEGSNNSYGLVGTSCQAYKVAETNADTITVRRASDTQPTTLDTTRVYLQTSRIQGTLFVPGCATPTNTACIPAAYSPPASQSRQLVVHSYYVDRQSTMQTNLPSLRRKTFSEVTTGTGVRDEEIAAGVEDLQVQFGIDTTNDTNADQYVDPDDVPAGASIVSATIWLRIRSEEPEQSQKDSRSYQYADMAAAYVPNDKYRRIVVSKTIQLRNTRT